MPSQGVLPRVKRFSFCWIGVCKRDDFKHSEVKWRLLPWLVLREYFVASFRTWDEFLTWYSDIAPHHFAKRNGFRELFLNHNAWCAFRTRFENQFQPVMVVKPEGIGEKPGELELTQFGFRTTV